MKQPLGFTSALLSPFLASTPLSIIQLPGGHLDSWLVALGMPHLGKGLGSTVDVIILLQVVWGTFHCPSVRMPFWGVLPIFETYSAEDQTLGGY